jgi:hypothetical protein
LVVACRSARAALKRTAARGCNNFNNLRKAAAGRVAASLEFCSGPFCCGRAIWVSNFDQTPTAKERMRVGWGAPESAHADNRSATMRAEACLFCAIARAGEPTMQRLFRDHCRHQVGYEIP